MDFPAFLSTVGLLVERPMPDGRIHRCATRAKPRKKNGAYRWLGEWGWAQCWDTMQEAAVWRADRTPGPFAPSRPAPAPQAVRALLEAERARHAQAAERAERIVAECQFMSHPYLARKGFPRQGGLVHPDGRLVVPMRSVHRYAQLQSVQFITEDGDKKFMPGCAAADAVYVLGPVNAPETWVTEGLATALSVQAALRLLHRPARVMVCFSAGNLARVGKQLRGRVFAVADNDASQAGERAAASIGHPWVMPDAVGTDANDLHAQQGLGALVALLRGAL